MDAMLATADYCVEVDELCEGVIFFGVGALPTGQLNEAHHTVSMSFLSHLKATAPHGLHLRNLACPKPCFVYSEHFAECDELPMPGAGSAMIPALHRLERGAS